MNITQLARSAAVTSGLSLGGKLLGIVRAFMIAATFGTAAELDAFWVAFLLPTVLPSVVQGIITTSVIPQYMRNLVNAHGAVEWRGLNTFFTAAVLIASVVSVILFVSAPGIVYAIAPGLKGEIHCLATNLARVMLLATVLMVVNAIIGALAQCQNRFVGPALESVTMNVVMIVAIWVFAQSAGIVTLAISVVCGVVVQQAVLTLTNLRLLSTYVRPAWDPRHRDFREPSSYMIPYIVGISGTYAGTFVDQAFLSGLDSGSISAMVYATMIAMLPLEVFGQAILATFYPTLSRQYGEGDREKMRHTYLHGLRLLTFILLPCSAVFVAFAEPLVTLLFQRKSFSVESAAITAEALSFASLALLPRAITYLNFRVLNAVQKPWQQVTIGLLGVVTNVIGDYILVEPLGIRGIALASAISALQSAILSSVVLNRTVETRMVQGYVKAFSATLTMVVVLVVAAKGWSYCLISWLDLKTPFWLAVAAMCGLPVGLVAFLLVGMVTNVPEVLIPYQRLVAALRAYRERNLGP